MTHLSTLFFNHVVFNPAGLDIFNNFKDNVANGVVDPFIRVIGAIAFVIGAWAIVRYLMGASQQGAGAHWVRWFVALVFGALFYVNGLSGWTDLGGTTTDQVKGLFQKGSVVASIISARFF